MSKIRRGRFVLCLLCLIIVLGCFASAAAVKTSSDPAETAAEPDEDDNGEPFTLGSTSIRNGSKDVALDVTIQLDFNKNIVNVAVAQNNIACYHLTSRDGSVVPIRIIMPDDQLQRVYKRSVFIQPQAELAPNTEYTLTVDNTLTAKNGNVLDQFYDITFTTGTAAAGERNEILTELGDNIVTYTSDLPVPVRNTEPVTAEEPVDSGAALETVSVVLAAVIVAVIIAVTVAYMLMRRRAQSR